MFNVLGMTFEKDTGLKWSEGNYLNDELHEYGKLFHTDNKEHSAIKYAGYFKQSDASGIGCQYYKNGKLRHRGNYKNKKIDRTVFFIEYKYNGTFLIDDHYTNGFNSHQVNQT